MLFVHVRQAPCCRRGGDGRDPTVATSMLDSFCSHACRYETTGTVVGRDSAVYCGGSAVGSHRLAWLFRAVYTGTRPGLTPAIRAGKGWRGRRELAPRCSATQFAARGHAPGQTRRVLNLSYHQHHHKAQTGCSVCVGDFCCAFMLSTMVGVGAAMRRRQRRLRAWAHHERLSIAMALATVEHHSYGPTANATPWSQTTGTSAREGEVREQHYGLRSQK